MGLLYNVYLTGSKIYGCKNCKAHLSNHEDIISRVRARSRPLPSRRHTHIHSPPLPRV